MRVCWSSQQNITADLSGLCASRQFYPCSDHTVIGVSGPGHGSTMYSDVVCVTVCSGTLRLLCGVVLWREITNEPTSCSGTVPWWGRRLWSPITSLDRRGNPTWPAAIRVQVLPEPHKGIPQTEFQGKAVSNIILYFRTVCWIWLNLYVLACMSWGYENYED